VFTALDHIELYVSNSETTRNLLVRLFGGAVKSRSAKRYQRLGASYVAFEQAPETNPAARMDHFSVSIKSLQMERLHAFLNQRGVTYRDYPSGRDTGINDPDDIRMQLSPEEGWSLLTEPNFRNETVATAEASLFRPTRLDHVLLNVTDVEKSAAFYRKILGPPTESRSGEVWFSVGVSRLGLRNIAAGERSGLNRIGILAESFDRAAIADRLLRLGISVEIAGGNTTNSVALRYPDGLIQVIGQ